MGVRVFVSYRRSDTQHIAGRLRDRLAGAFGGESVFFDVVSIEFGLDFREVIRETLRNVDAVVAVIGPNFDCARLANPDDSVRMELLEALTQRKVVLPVLADHASMPKAAELPAELAKLAYLNAASLRPDPDFHGDADRLVQSLRRTVGRPPSTVTSAAAPRPESKPSVSAAPLYDPHDHASQSVDRTTWTADLLTRKQSNKPNFTIVLRGTAEPHHLEFLGSLMGFRVTLDGAEIWRGKQLLTPRSIAFVLVDGGHRSRGQLHVHAGMSTYRARVEVEGTEILSFERRAR